MRRRWTRGLAGLVAPMVRVDAIGERGTVFVGERRKLRGKRRRF